MLLFALIAFFFSVFSSCHKPGNTTDNTRHIDSLVDASLEIYDPQHLDKIFHFMDSAYAAFPYNDKDLARKHIWMALTYEGVANYQKSLVCVDSAFDITGTNPEEYKNEHSDALFLKGGILLNLNEYEKAFQQFYKGRQFVQRYLDTCTYAKYTNCLGSVCFIQKKYREAIKYMKEAYEQDGHCNEGNFQWAFNERQGALDNIGICYEKLGLYDSSIMYYKKALDFIAANQSKYPNEQESVKVGRAVIMGNLGGVYVKNNNYTEAEVLLKENIAVNNQNEENSQDARYSAMKLSKLYMKEGRFDDALKQLKATRADMLKRPPVKGEEECKWLQLVSDYYDTTGNTRLAYDYYRSYIHARDSIELSHKELPGVDFNKTFDHMNQEGQIASLKKEKTNANRFLFVAVVLSVMAVIIIYLVWSNYRQSKNNLLRQKKLNKQISTHNVTMQKTLNALEQSQQSNTRMMRVVAHDLHNPVSAMVSLIDLLSDGDYDEEQQEMFQMLATSGTNALKLIGDILHAKPSMEMERLQLDELVTYSVGLMQYRANEKKQILELDVVPATVIADREKVWRVINNLIVNAIKFSYEGKSIYLKLSCSNGLAILSVRDEGVGMSEIMSGQIFENFAIGGRTGTAGEESFGLGLSISKQIIDAHGGKIWFESKVGVGTTFYVELKCINGIDDQQDII